MEGTKLHADKILVAYFIQKGKETSGSKKIADKVVAALKDKGHDSTEFAITPVEIYPEDKATFEMVTRLEKDNRHRPEIVDKVGKMQDYKYVVLVAPNWYDDVPMAVYKFFDEYDFGGKRVVPVINHDGTGHDKVRESIREFLPHTWVTEGVGISSADDDAAAVEEAIKQLFMPSKSKF